MTVVVLIAALAALIPALEAHPGSGIVVDARGDVYFIDTGTGAWKIDGSGRLTRLGGQAFHWMALDGSGGFATADLGLLRTPQSEFERVDTRPGGPVLIASSDYPVAFDSRGRMYWAPYQKDRPLALVRAAPGERASVFITVPPAAGEAPIQWFNGIAAGPDDSIYYTENDAVRKVDADGRISTITAGIRPEGCSTERLSETPPGPYLRELEVTPAGTVYVAANGCRQLLRITPRGEVSVVARAESPWSPTGVAFDQGNVYVLEYDHSEIPDRQWPPRVRKLAPDGRISTLVTFPRDRRQLDKRP